MATSTTVASLLSDLTNAQSAYQTALNSRLSAINTALAARPTLSTVNGLLSALETKMVGIAGTDWDTFGEVMTKVLEDKDAIGALTSQIATRTTEAQVTTLISNALAAYVPSTPAQYTTLASDLAGLQIAYNQTVGQLNALSSSYDMFTGSTMEAFGNVENRLTGVESQNAVLLAQMANKAAASDVTQVTEDVQGILTSLTAFWTAAATNLATINA